MEYKAKKRLEDEEAMAARQISTVDATIYMDTPDESLDWDDQERTIWSPEFIGASAIIGLGLFLCGVCCGGCLLYTVRHRLHVGVGGKDDLNRQQELERLDEDEIIRVNAHDLSSDGQYGTPTKKPNTKGRLRAGSGSSKVRNKPTPNQLFGQGYKEQKPAKLGQMTKSDSIKPLKTGKNASYYQDTDAQMQATNNAFNPFEPPAKAANAKQSKTSKSHNNNKALNVDDFLVTEEEPERTQSIKKRDKRQQASRFQEEPQEARGPVSDTQESAGKAIGGVQRAAMGKQQP